MLILKDTHNIVMFEICNCKPVSHIRLHRSEYGMILNTYMETEVWVCSEI